MAKLQIGNRVVEVDDSFLSLSPADQQLTVDEIEATLNSNNPVDPKATGPAGVGRPEGFLGAFASGVQRALGQEEANLRATAGLVRRAWNPEGGDTMLEDAVRYSNQAAQQHPRGVEGVETIFDAPASRLTTYLGDTLGEGLTQIATTIGTGGIAGVGAKLAARKATSKVAQKVLAKAPIAAMAGKTVATETGGTAIELREATGETHAGKAVAAGLGKGALELVFPALLGKAAGLTDEAFGSLSGKLEKLMQGSTKARIAKGAAVGVGVEGATEGAQEAIDAFTRSLADDEYEFMSSETGLRILNAAVAGSIVGGGAGAASSALTGEVAKEEDIPAGELPTNERPSVQINRPTVEGLPELEAALTQEEAEVKAISATLADLNAGRPVGSSANHKVLGFEELPEPFKYIGVNHLTDLNLAPMELVNKELHATRKELNEGIRVLEDDPLEIPTRIKLRSEVKRMSNTLAMVRSAAINPDSQGVPSAVVTTDDADPLFTDLDDANASLLRRGFMVKPYNNEGALQLSRVIGQNQVRPVFNFPNDVLYRDVISKVMDADSRLETGGFYAIASRNLNKLHNLKGTVNLQTLVDIRNTSDRAAAYRKAVQASSVLEPFKAAERPSLGTAAAMMEAGQVKFNKMMDWGYTLLQWAQHNPHLTPLQNFKDIVQSEKGVSMRTISRADEILKKFMRLGKDQQDAAYAFMESLGRMSYRTQEEIDAKIVRQPTAEEERLLITGARYRKNKTRLLRETYQTVVDMRQMVHDEFNNYVRDATAELQYLTDPKQRLAQMKSIQKMVDTFYSRPRFPFATVGQFVTSVHNEEGVLVDARQTEFKSESDRDIIELSAKYPETFKITATRLPERERAWTALPKQVIRDLAQKGYLKGVSKEQRELLEFLADIGPENRRRFISGMNPRKKAIDLQRSFAMWAQNLANANFARRAGPALEREIQTLEASRRATKGADTRSLGLMVQALGQKLDSIINPPDDWQRMKNFAFMWHLAFNVKSALVNATQVPLATYPYLAARFGDVKAVNSLKNAYLDKRTLFINGKVGNLNDSLNRILSKGVEEGKFDQSFATELASLAEGTNMARALAGSKFDRLTKEVSYYGSYLFAAIEKMNRSVVGRATAQLALDNPNTRYLQELKAQQPRAMDRLMKEGFSEQEAVAYLAAVDAVDRTMFEYAKWNRPKFMQGGAKGAIFTFWMFTQGMLHFAVHSPGALRFWLVMLATAGVMGLPGAEDLAKLVNAIGQRFFGKDFNPEHEARKLIKAHVDPLIQRYNPDFETASDLMLHGLSKEGFGLSAAADAIGIPWVPNLDLSRSLSMGRISPLGPELLKPGIDYNRALAESTERLSGAAFGPLFGVVEALRADGNDYKRWEKAMPAALKSFLRAGRFQAEGRERDSKLGTVLDFDPHEPGHQAEIIATAFGFTPTRLSKKWDEKMALQDAINYWDTRRAILLKQMDYATYMKDKEAKTDVLAAIKKFNSQLPDHFKTKTITAKTVKNSLRERARRRQQGYSKQDLPAVKYFELTY